MNNVPKPPPDTYRGGRILNTLANHARVFAKEEYEYPAAVERVIKHFLSKNKTMLIGEIDSEAHEQGRRQATRELENLKKLIAANTQIDSLDINTKRIIDYVDMMIRELEDDEESIFSEALAEIEKYREDRA